MKGASIQVGSTGIGGDQHAFAAALNALLGTRLKPIAGYPGTQEIMLAVERGELDGIVGYSWGVAKSGNKAQLDDGSLKIILQLALAKHKELPAVPLVTDFVKNPEDRQVLEMIFSRQSMGRPVVAPPGVDPRVIDALRKAFADTMRDPQFVAEGAKIGLELDFVSGAAVQSLVERLYRSPPQVVSRAAIRRSSRLTNNRLFRLQVDRLRQLGPAIDLVSISFWNSSGVLTTASAPSVLSRCCISGVRMPSAISFCRRLRTAGGVPARASSPNHCSASKPGTPASAMVGASGIALVRFALVTPEDTKLAGFDMRFRGQHVEHHAGNVAAEDVGHGL